MSGDSQELFRFISKPEIKTHLQADLDELHGCMKSGLWKASIVLVGSLIEAVLYYHIEQTDSIRNSIPRFAQRHIGLNDLLQWAREHKVIDDGLFRLSEPIRDYRNLIHPRVQQRIGIQVTENLVQIGYNVLLEIIHSANKHHHLLISTDAKATVTAIVQETCNRAATKADFQVYVPILQKYGSSRGGRIVRRSLRIGLLSNE
jgi:hypothetical protein